MAGRVRGILEKLLGRRREIALSEVIGDVELLRRFSATRDEAAFELLVWRHGSMVLGVCRRGVRDEQLAEDAFQAVFLVLARKAGSIRGGNVAGWLFRLARRVVVRAARRQPVLKPLPELPAAARPSTAECGELRALLDAEVARLPERLRAPVILCYLGDHTTEDAARELGCPRGTVLSRLAAARKRLADRLTRRGIAAPTLSAVMAERTTGRLVSQTITAAQNPFPSPAASPPALLAESVVRAMTMTKLVSALSVVFLAVGLSAGVGWVAASRGSSGNSSPIEQAQAEEASKQAANGAEKKEAKPAEKSERIRKAASVVSRQIEEIELRLAEEVRDPALVNLSVLQEELLALDKRILEAERTVKANHLNWKRELKNKDEAPKRPPEKDEVARQIEAIPIVKAASVRRVEAESALLILQQRRAISPEHPSMKAAVKELSDADMALKDAREKARPEAERLVLSATTEYVDKRFNEARIAVDQSSDSLKDLLTERRNLADRIRAGRVSEARQQALQDELQIYREIRAELLRQRILIELGIEGLPMPIMKSAADPGMGAKTQDPRRELESMRAEVTKMREQTEALGQQIESLRTEVKRFRK
jgi:RNA polymerase sigma factor (sigma-70 family)